MNLQLEGRWAVPRALRLSAKLLKMLLNERPLLCSAPGPPLGGLWLWPDRLAVGSGDIDDDIESLN
jgi:hypothetical protein